MVCTQGNCCGIERHGMSNDYQQCGPSALPPAELGVPSLMGRSRSWTHFAWMKAEGSRAGAVSSFPGLTDSLPG